MSDQGMAGGTRRSRRVADLREAHDEAEAAQHRAKAPQRPVGHIIDTIVRTTNTGSSRVPGVMRKAKHGEQEPQYDPVSRPGPLADTPRSGAGRPLAANNFAGGKYDETTLKEDTVLYRTGATGRAMGEWFTREPPAAAPRVFRSKKGGGSTPQESVHGVSFPAGTAVYTGIGLTGEEQVHVPKPWKIEGARKVSRAPLPRSPGREERVSKQTEIPQGGGSALPGELRSKMEGQLGADLSGVKIHTGSDSAKAATGFNARAFTVGQDVHFGAGEYAPGTKEGDRLLAHELTHTVQAQKSGIQRKEKQDGAEGVEGQQVSQPGEPAEVEADAMADQAVDNIHDGGDDKKADEKKGDKKEGATAEKKDAGAAEKKDAGAADKKDAGAADKKDGAAADKKDAGAADKKDGAAAEKKDEAAAEKKEAGITEKKAEAGADSKASEKPANEKVGEKAPAVAAKALPAISQSVSGLILTKKGGGPAQSNKPAPPSPTQGPAPQQQPKKDKFTDINLDTSLGQQVSVKQVGGKLALRVGTGNGSKAIQDVLSVKHIAQAKNATALTIIEKAITAIDAAEQGVTAISGVAADGVDKGVQQQAQGFADKAQKAINQLQSEIKLESVARMKKTEPLPQAAELFNANDIPQEAKAVFKAEMKRQLDLQESQMNKQTLDEWIANVDTYQSADQSWFTSLNDEAKKVVVKEMMDRMAALEEELQKKMPPFKEAKKLVDAIIAAQAEKSALPKNAKAAEKAAAEKKVQDAKAAAMANEYIRNNVLGRHGNEDEFAEAHQAGVKALLKQHGDDWEMIGAEKQSLTAILHNQDQVAGGKGKIPPLDPVPAPGRKGHDPKEWQTYLQKLKKLVGSAKVNSTIGGQWSERIKIRRAAYMADPGPKGYPFFTMNFSLKPGNI